MAYGVKYRLEFSDVKGNGKKVEILKKDYTGSVLPMVGTGEPVVISWEGDEDFYQPIIGSNCTLNLFVTDDVNYDNFYAYDEDEYQVKVYYKDALDAYQLFWAGFIVVDSFKQAMATTPYQITIQAVDGLGLLSTKKMTIRDTDRFTSFSQQRDLRYNLIEDAIGQTNLGLGVRFSINWFPTSGTSQIWEFDYGNGFPKFDKDLEIIDCKTYIENILKSMNARIFQANGFWYVISNSEYIDSDFFDDQISGTISTEIRANETKMLQINRTESPYFREYTSAGNLNQTITEDILMETKTDLIPIDDDLSVEYIPPVNLIQETVQLENVNIVRLPILTDPTFELPTGDWTILNSAAQIGEYDYFLSGTKSLKIDTKTSNVVFTKAAQCQSQLAGINGISFTKNEQIDYVFNYYLDADINESLDIPFDIMYEIKREYDINNTNVAEYWNTNFERWDSTSVTNRFTVDKNSEKFRDFTVTTVEDSSKTDCLVTLSICIPYMPSGSFNAIYFDNIFGVRKSKFPKEHVVTLTRDKNSKKIENEFTPLRWDFYMIRARNYGESPANHHFEKTIVQQKMNDFRTHVPRYEGVFYNENVIPVSPRNKIWINFSEKFVTTSQAGTSTTTLHTTDVDTSNDKVGWYVTGGNITTAIKITAVNASSYTLDGSITYSSGDVFALSKFNAVHTPVSNLYATHEPVSCMIDSMEYNVKSNTVSVVMHVPNQDDDVSATFARKIKSEIE